MDRQKCQRFMSILHLCYASIKKKENCRALAQDGYVYTGSQPREYERTPPPQKKSLIQDGVLMLTRSGKTVKCNCDIDIRATHTEKTITVQTYLSCKHKQSNEEDEERDGAHGLQVF